MKPLFRITLLGLLVIATADELVCSPTGAENLVFIGKDVRVAPGPLMDSGGVLSYRLALYQIEKVCTGTYQGRTIVVDHLLRSGTELMSLKTGDRLCVGVVKSKTIDFRYNVSGIREPNEKTRTFYIGVYGAGPVEQCECR